MRGKFFFQQLDSSQPGLQWKYTRKAVLRISLDPCEWVIMTVCRFQFPKLCCGLGEESPAIEGAARISDFGLQMSPIMMLGTGAGGSRARDISLSFAAFQIVSGRSRKRASHVGRGPLVLERRFMPLSCNQPPNLSLRRGQNWRQQSQGTHALL